MGFADFMDIEIPLVILLTVLFLLLGMASVAFTSALRSVNLQRFEEEHDMESYERLLALRQEHSRSTYSLNIVYAFSAVMSVMMVTHEAFSFTGPAGMAVAGTLYSIGWVLVQAVVSALSERYAENLTSPGLAFSRIADVICYPVGILLASIATRVGGPQTDEEAREEMEDEITAIMDEAVQDGTLDADEYRILTNIMQFSEVTVKDVMTPRNVVFSLPAATTVAEIVDRGELQTYSRFPICKEQSLDDVIGYCLTRDILYAAVHGRHSLSMDKLCREVHFIPENVRLDKVLEEFLTRRQHLFLVVDEYGGVEGLITMEDVVETILGAEIVDEADRVVDMRQLASLRRDQRIAGSTGQQPVAATRQPANDADL
jgi:CBS domain containing-hemolysin-like protein